MGFERGEGGELGFVVWGSLLEIGHVSFSLSVLEWGFSGCEKGRKEGTTVDSRMREESWEQGNRKRENAEKKVIKIWYRMRLYLIY